MFIQDQINMNTSQKVMLEHELQDTNQKVLISSKDKAEI